MKHPLGPAGTMVNERAVTVPEALLVPAAATHSPVLRAEIETMSDRVSRTVVGTMTVTMVPLASFTDTDVPLTPPGVTWPLALPRLAACGGGVKLRFAVAPALRRPPKPPNAPPPVQDPLTGARTDTVDAVMWPVESFWPAAVTHAPGVISATVPVLVCATGVFDVYATVVSPLALLRIRVAALICTN